MPQWFHEMIKPVMMLCVFMLNARTSFRRMDVKSGQEAERLQQVLIEELRALSELLQRISICWIITSRF
jgi:hypothetical protein